MDSQEVNGELSHSPSLGLEMRRAFFGFAQGYTPLNHGSYGTIPEPVAKFRRDLQSETEARPDTFIRYTYLKLLKEARAAVAPLLGADTDEVVFVSNATAGVNTVLRNLEYEKGDVILHFSTIYGACLKTIQSLQETTQLEASCVNLTYPIEDDDVLPSFKAAVQTLRDRGKVVKVATFDTVLSFPGVRFPWETLVRACKDLKILSLVDGAHGLGHIDLTHLGELKPDFFISNCHKWLMTPRGSAVLYVPYHNQPLIRTMYPTSWGYEPPSSRDQFSTSEYFVGLFSKTPTSDNTPYLCVVEALKFRKHVCGGEAAIREYCEHLARDGGKLMANILGTEVLENRSESLQKCCFTNVRLPLKVRCTGEGERDTSSLMEDEISIAAADACDVAEWIQERTMMDFETFIPTIYYSGAFWVRISAQIYLSLPDFEWAARILLKLCDRARAGEWKSDST